MTAPVLPNVNDRSPVVFRALLDCRRIRVYLLVGWLTLVGAVAVMLAYDLMPEDRRFAHDRTLAFVIAAAVFSVVMLVPAVLIHRYHLRIDHDGIWRRYLIRWDVWSWAAFADGRVRQRPSGRPIYEFPSKPWPFRRLAPYLADSDNKVLTARIQEVLPPLPPPELPERITIRYAFAKLLELSQDGLRLRRNRHDDGQLYSWDHVQQVRLTRADHAYRDFLQLEIDLPLPAKSVRLDRGGNNRNWRGPNSEVIAYCLERYLPPERVEIAATSGLPRSIAEADRRLAELDRRDRELRKGWWAMIGLFVAAYVVMGVVLLIDGELPNWDGLRWTGIGVLSLVPILFLVGVRAVDGSLRKQLSGERERLLQWRMDLIQRP